MIKAFDDRETEKIWNGIMSKKLPIEIQDIARRKLRMLNSAQDLSDLRIPPANKLEKLKNLHLSIKGSSKCTGYFGAVSLTNKEPTTGKHSDPIDVIYCQFVGSVTWTIFDENKSNVFILNPGDIIYVPKSVVHEVKYSNPRAAISFMFEAS